MAFTRIALMTPQSGREAHVRDLLEQLVQFHSQQPGFVTGYVLAHQSPERGGPQVGRLTVWESEEASNHVAQIQHDMALQSEIKNAVVDETHEEHSFVATPA